jgi:hypothetical protein
MLRFIMFEEDPEAALLAADLDDLIKQRCVQHLRHSTNIDNAAPCSTVYQCALADQQHSRLLAADLDHLIKQRRVKHLQHSSVSAA